MTFTLPEPQKYGYIAKSENLYTEAQMLKLRDDTIAAMLLSQSAEIAQLREALSDLYTAAFRHAEVPDSEYAAVTRASALLA